MSRRRWPRPITKVSCEVVKRDAPVRLLKRAAEHNVIRTGVNELLRLPRVSHTATNEQELIRPQVRAKSPASL